MTHIFATKLASTALVFYHCATQLELCCRLLKANPLILFSTNTPTRSRDSIQACIEELRALAVYSCTKISYNQ